MNTLRPGNIAIAIMAAGAIIAIGVFVSGGKRGEAGAISATGGGAPAAQAEALPGADTALASASATTTITDAIGRSLLSSIITAKSTGQPISNAYVNNTVASILNSADADATAKVPEFTPQIIENPSPATQKGYLSVIGYILGQYLGASPGSGVGSSDIDQMNFVANVYAAMAKDLEQVPAPKAYADFHVSLVNDAHSLSYYYSVMAKADTDPAAVLLAGPKIKQASEDLAQTMLSMGAQAKRDGIIFTENDPGILLMQ